MAIMYPNFGPKINDSAIAEPLVYELLKNSLDDKFHVIHSIPWLSSIVDEYRVDKKSPIGEIDFLVLHAFYGVLAIEVKGGVIKHNSTGFYYSRTDQRINPAGQLRRGTFAVQNWFRSKGHSLTIGHAYFFPQSEMQLNDLPPDVVDFTHEPAIKLVIDLNDIERIEKRVTGIMDYFRNQFPIKSYKDEYILQLISMILPEKDYSPCWYARVKNDNRMWLRLTAEQNECIQLASEKRKFLVSGWPGSGKTIVAIQTARNFSQAKLNVLFVTFNKLIAAKIVNELADFDQIAICTFHALCRKAAESIAFNGNGLIWLEDGAYIALEQARIAGFFENYDVLIVDEGQAIRDVGWNTLSLAFAEKRVVVMFDGAQAFSYEQPTTQVQIESLFSSKTFLLTQSLRIPKVVCNRIKLFNSPEYTVTNPRFDESDALLEIVTHSQEKTFANLILQFRADNIPQDWITVLKPSSEKMSANLVPEGIKVETIGRYRGMESPIIIVFAKGDITDAELFCAYSRATSRCIVILDAHEVKDKNYASLGKQIYLEQKDAVEGEIEKSFTSTILSNTTLSFQKIVDGNFRLRWCEEWDAYALDGKFSGAIHLLLISHFVNTETPIVYTWSESLRDCLQLIPQSASKHVSRVGLKFCQNCGALTPHVPRMFSASNYVPSERLVKFPSDKSRVKCLVCNTLKLSRSELFEDHCKLISDILDNPNLFSDEERKNVDPYVFSIGVLLRHGVNHKDSFFIGLLKSAGADLSLVALILSIYIIHRDLKRNISEHRIKAVAEESYNFNSQLANLSFTEWQGYINGAFLHLERIDAVESTMKGYRKVNEAVFKLIFKGKD